MSDILAFPPAAFGGSPQRVVVSDALRREGRILIAASGALREVIARAERIAGSRAPVLIQGETGTGKELIARLVHELSPRRHRPLVQVNCAAFSETLVHSELFGHEKGAFTGADHRHCGYFERADSGSLLLDEIGEMPLGLQAKFLRVLEEEAFQRVGGEQLLRSDVRIIATTNRDLEIETAERQFRSDLLYRLNALTLSLPPLRARPEEIPHLVHHFIERFGKESPHAVASIAPRALDLLQRYPWPGNIRQLRNVINHACVFAQGPRIEVEDLPPLTCAPRTTPSSSPRTLAEVERERILQTLQEVGGNRTAAANRLGITARTLQNKLKLYREAS